MICKSCGGDLKHEAHGLCKRCYDKQQHVKYYEIHKDKLKQRSVEYSKTHKEEIKQYKKEYRITNRDAILVTQRKYRYAHGAKPASENKQCPIFLGVHVAERVLSKVFKNVEQMPYGHKGFDFRCNKGKQIDVKSSCAQTRDNQSDRWGFQIRRNQIADYFLCLAFDNREDLNPLHIWLIPGHIINHVTRTSISESTLSKWDEYKLDINKVAACWDSMKETQLWK